MSVQAIAVALKLDLAGAIALEAFIEAIDIASQATMPDEETHTLGLTAHGLCAVQIVARLKTVERAIQPWCDGAGQVCSRFLP